MSKELNTAILNFLSRCARKLQALLIKTTNFIYKKMYEIPKSLIFFLQLTTHRHAYTKNLMTQRGQKSTITHSVVYSKIDQTKIMDTEHTESEANFCQFPRREIIIRVLSGRTDFFNDNCTKFSRWVTIFRARHGG